MPRPVLCHFCHLRKVSVHGGDLHCSVACRKNAAAVKQEAEVKLASNGFTRHERVLNLWEKNGAHISIDQVIREGLAPTLGRHAAAVAQLG